LMYYQSPVGLLKININDGMINEIIFSDSEDEIKAGVKKDDSDKKSKTVIKKCQLQFDEYFSGKRFHFDLPVHQMGTPFQERVWNELVKIPFGKTISYLQLSQRIGNVKSIRAVGTANGRNMLSIVVPCHRVIGSDGSLTGYAGGLWRKQWLLEHENKYANGVHLLF
ncbi:MAG TPA: methylated-DNA--[protein]-cysteine S-methyltransferase, partial [Hanamia sp.]